MTHTYKKLLINHIYFCFFFVFFETCYYPWNLSNPSKPAKIITKPSIQSYKIQAIFHRRTIYELLSCHIQWKMKYKYSNYNNLFETRFKQTIKDTGLKHIIFVICISVIVIFYSITRVYKNELKISCLENKTRK